MLGWKRNDGWKKNLLGLVMLVLSACFLFGVMEAQQGGRIERERIGQKEGRGRFPELMERFGQRFPSEPSFFPPNSRQRLSGLGFRSRQSRQRSQNVELIGFTGVSIYDVFVKDDYAYCASVLGLLILDVSNPSNSQLVGKLLLPYSAQDVCVSGNYAYVADGDAGLRVIDVSNPSNPREVGYFDTPGYALGVYVSGNYAYVADGVAGLRVIDVSNPTNPREVGYFDTPGYALGVYVSGNYAYVADGVAGLRVIDVSNPSNPREVGYFDTPGDAQGVYVSGNYAYVADKWAGLRVIDVSNPTNPREVGYFDTPSEARDVYVSGNYAYVADGENTGLRVIDVSNPTNPREVGYFDIFGFTYGVYVSGNYAYVANGIGYAIGGGNVVGLVVIDVSNPSNPRKVGHFGTSDATWDVYVSGNYAYVANGVLGLRVIDVSDPSKPREVGFFDTRYALGVYVSGDYAYVAAGVGLVVIDVSNPTNPREVGFFDTPGWAWDVYVSGNYAYVADWDAGLRVIDVSNPTNPREVGFFDTPGLASGVYVSGNYAYVADWGGGLRVIDVSNPANLREVGFFTQGRPLGVYVSGNYAYVADWDAGLRVIDVSNPTNPREVGFFDTPGHAEDVYVSGNYAYVADGDAGLRVIDVSNPSNPREVGFFDTPGYVSDYARDVYVSGNYAYVANSGEGLFILRFTGAQPVNHPPSIPVLLSPANNATVSPVPTFKLKSDDPDNDQVMFIMEVKQGSILKSFQTGFYSSGVEVTYSDSRQPLIDGQWQWRAKARDKRGAESGWSEWKTFTVQSNLPDLVPIDLKVTPDTVRLGNKVTVSFKVLNQGRKRANASKTRIILSKSASEPSSSDPLLKELSTPALDPNKSQDYSESVVIPADIQTGDYYVWVVVDVDKTSGQGDDTNDKVKFPIKVQEKFDYDVLVVEEVVRKEGGKEIIEEKPVAGARIIVFDENHNIITEGTTNREGKAKIPALKVGHYIRAEKYITTFYLNDKNEAVEQKTNRKFYDVYLTSDEVENSGFIFNEVKALPVKLVIRKHNALIKFHLELAFEWDADAKTRDFWIAALRHASNLLYDATDGHVCIGSVKVLNNYRYPTPYGEYTGVPRNAIQVFADNDIRPYVWGLGMYGVHIGRMWISSVGDWRTIQPELLGSVLAHEFGHCLLLLDDEYDYKTNDPKCVEPEIDQKDEYGHFNDPGSKIACLMAAPWDADKSRKVSSYSSGGISFGEGWWKASELCSEVPERHTYKNRLFYGDKSCWEIFKEKFSDQKGRWILRSPVDREFEVDREDKCVPGPVFVRSYTESGKGRLINIENQKDNIGKEMDIDYSEWKYSGGRVEELNIKSWKNRFEAHVAIYSLGRFIYQGRTKREKINIERGKINIEGYHSGDFIEVFTVNRFWLGKLPPSHEIILTPESIYQNLYSKIDLSLDGSKLYIQAKFPKEFQDLRIQLVVQSGKESPEVLPIRESKLVFSEQLKSWVGVLILKNEKEGYFRISRGEGKTVVAWVAFGGYDVGNPPFPIVGGAGRLRLMNGFGFLEAPNATSDAKIFFVVTPPFVFNQSDLIPRSYAYDFKVLSGNLGNDSRLELVFEPIEATNPKRLCVYQFSEEKQEWEPIDAEIDLEEGIIVISPARSGTFALMEVAEKPPSFTFPSGLQMIGIPFRPSRSAPSEVLNLGSGEIKLARWKPKEGRYAFYRPNEQEQDEEVAKVVPGKGYWVLFDKPVSIVQQGGLIPEEGVTIPLVAGWNQISNPFIKPIEWSLSEFYVSKDGEVKSLEEARQAGWIEDYAWGWEQDANNPNTGRYVLVYDTSIIPGVKGQLEPWKGYWVYAHTDCELILPPPSQNKGRGTRGEGRVAKGNGWNMRLQASVNGSVGEAVMGIANGTRGLAVGLPPEPPTGNNGVQVILLKNNTPLAVDVRSDGSRRQEWEVLVRFGTRDGGRGTSERKEVVLTFDGIGYAPKDVSAWLVDTVTGKRLYLRTQPSYRFVAQEGEVERKFKVVVERGNDRPLRVVGLKATPMRGQGVVIEFSLTKPAKIEAEVLTLTGRKVAVLDAGSSEGLTHRVVWRGVGIEGQKVGSGVYLVRVRAVDEEGRETQAVTVARMK
jgi:hypothetical protein